MADNTNTYASAQPFQNTVSDWMAGQERMDFAKREEERQIKAIADAQKRREDEQYNKDLEYFLKRPNFKPTGNRAIDQVMTEVLLQAVDEQGNIEKEFTSYGRNISNEKRTELIMRKRNLDNLPEYLDVAHKAYNDQATQIQEGIRSGKIKPTPELLKKLESFSEGYFDVTLDGNGKILVGVWDKDGDGKPDIMRYEDLITKSMFGETIPNADFAKSFLEKGKELGTHTETSDFNFVKDTTKMPVMKQVDLLARSSLYGNNGALSNEAKSWLYDNYRVTDFNNVPEQYLNKMEEEAKSIMLSAVDTEKSKEVDYSARLAAQKAAEEKAKAKEGGIGTPVVPSEGTWGGALKTIDTDTTRSVPVTKKIILPAVHVGEGKDAKMLGAAQILNYTYDKEGRMVIDAAYSDGKINIKDDDASISTQLDRRKRFTASKETESRIAQQLGMSVDELRNSTRAQTGAYDDL